MGKKVNKNKSKKTSNTPKTKKTSNTSKIKKPTKSKRLTNKQKKALENKKIIIITVISIICLLTLILASTYSVLVTRKSSNQKDLYKTGNLSVDFVDGNNNISLQKAIPTSDDIGSKYEPYTFDIKSGESAENNYSSNYTVRLVPNATTNMSLDKIKIKVNDDDPVLLSSFTDNIIDSGTLQKNETKSYKIRLWMDIDAGYEAEDQLFSAKIVVSGQAVRD